jgi:isocitrate dehydrogenase
MTNNHTQGSRTITVARGDGIGPEIMDATLFILKESGARLNLETVEIGEKVYKRGSPVGIEPSAWESLRRTKVFLKAPITTPQGGGFNSLNVTVRKALGLYANVRPCVSYHPFIATKQPGMDLVIVRENEEDLYGGIEYRLSDEMYQCLKLVSLPGCEKIIRYAFNYARLNKRKKVTCFTKDNIMKLTDGLFHKTFERIATEFPEIQTEHWIVDIGAAKLADTPKLFEVIVMPNLYGDILSDVVAQIAGSVGLAGSANIGEACAMFEAIHGSAPIFAGQNIANPSGLFLAAVMMLVHIGQPEIAALAHNAWLRTIEDGVHTADIYKEGVSREKVGTRQFAEALAARLGKQPESLKPVSYAEAKALGQGKYARSSKPVRKQIMGVDVYLQYGGLDPQSLADKLMPCQTGKLKLSFIGNRGVKVWPEGWPETFCTDSWRCRFSGEAGSELSQKDIVELLTKLTTAGIDFGKTEQLTMFDGQPGYSLGQGE